MPFTFGMRDAAWSVKGSQLMAPQSVYTVRATWLFAGMPDVRISVAARLASVIFWPLMLPDASITRTKEWSTAPDWPDGGAAPVWVGFFGVHSTVVGAALKNASAALMRERGGSDPEKLYAGLSNA